MISLSSSVFSIVRYHSFFSLSIDISSINWTISWFLSLLSLHASLKCINFNWTEVLYIIKTTFWSIFYSFSMAIVTYICCCIIVCFNIICYLILSWLLYNYPQWKSFFVSFGGLIYNSCDVRTHVGFQFLVVYKLSSKKKKKAYNHSPSFILLNYLAI